MLTRTASYTLSPQRTHDKHHIAGTISFAELDAVALLASPASRLKHACLPCAQRTRWQMLALASGSVPSNAYDSSSHDELGLASLAPRWSCNDRSSLACDSVCFSQNLTPSNSIPLHRLHYRDMFDLLPLTCSATNDQGWMRVKMPMDCRIRVYNEGHPQLSITRVSSFQSALSLSLSLTHTYMMARTKQTVSQSFNIVPAC